MYKNGKQNVFQFYGSGVQNFKSIAHFFTPKWAGFVSKIITIYDSIFHMRLLRLLDASYEKKTISLHKGFTN